MNAKSYLNTECRFFLKVFRNSIILSGLLLLSVWATGELTFILCKPVIIFLIGYILTEAAKRYKLNPSNIPKKKLVSDTMFF